MTSDPSTLSPTPVPAADTHSSHSLCPSPLALCLSQSRPVSIYLYLYRYEINYMSRFGSFPGDGLWGSGFRSCCLMSLSVVISLFCILLGCSHPKAVLIMDSHISVRGTQPYPCPIGLPETQVSPSHYSSCLNVNVFVCLWYFTI